MNHPEYINSIWEQQLLTQKHLLHNKPGLMAEVPLAQYLYLGQLPPDNIIVVYDIYVDGTLKTSSTSNSAAVTVTIRLQHIHFALKNEQLRKHI